MSLKRAATVAEYIFTAVLVAAFVVFAASAALADRGMASWYGSEGGPLTATGEAYNPMGLTAAHRTLPMGTRVRVTCLHTGRAVDLRINDRGPAPWTGKMIDVSRGAARALGFEQRGVCPVHIEVLR